MRSVSRTQRLAPGVDPNGAKLELDADPPATLNGGTPHLHDAGNRFVAV